VVGVHRVSSRRCTHTGVPARRDLEVLEGCAGAGICPCSAPCISWRCPASALPASPARSQQSVGSLSPGGCSPRDARGDAGRSERAVPTAVDPNGRANERVVRPGRDPLGERAPRRVPRPDRCCDVVGSEAPPLPDGGGVDPGSAKSGVPGAEEPSRLVHHRVALSARVDRRETNRRGWKPLATRVQFPCNPRRWFLR